VVMGTVGYMSPEQAQGKRVDHRSDIFSFGCLLYEAATGQRAFESESTIDTLHKIVHAPVPLVKDVNASAPGDLTRIVRRCLAKDPDERYQSIKEAAIELRDVRRELEGAEELDTTTPPSSVGSAISSDTSGGMSASGAQVARAPASSAEYLITGLRQHKLAAVIVLAALVLSGVGLAAYLHARNTEVAIESIAVLPFVNQNRDPETEYLSDGLTESIINSLTQLPNLKVIPSSSAFRYKGKETDPLVAGKELGVRAILAGHVMQRGDKVTISTALIDVSDNKALWREQYNEKVADLLSVQRQIASQITTNLRLKLSGAEQSRVNKNYTESAEAYQLYLKGRFWWNKRTGQALKKAIEYFNQAIEKDPAYALAYAGMADACVLIPAYAAGPPQEYYP